MYYCVSRNQSLKLQECTYTLGEEVQITRGVLQKCGLLERKLESLLRYIFIYLKSQNHLLGLKQPSWCGIIPSNYFSENRFCLYVLLQVYGPEATMTGICKQAIECIGAAA